MAVPQRRRTLGDVARLAGVSTASASMALSDSPRVAAATKEAVRRAAEELGYVPHSAGRALRGQRVGAVAVVVPHSTRHVFSHPVLMDLLEGITSVANENDLMTILSTAQREQDESSAYLRIMRGRRADGVIVAGAAVSDVHIAQLVRAGYPVTMVGRSTGLAEVASVGIDDVGGARRAVGHLVEAHGARRIAHIFGPLGHQSAIDKRDGYLETLADAGLSMDPRLQFEGDYGEPSGAEAARAFLPHLGTFDAVFCANDQMAMGALQVFREHGVHTPSDLLVVGYDDHPLVRYSQPALTTVRADMVRVGAIAARRLLSIVDGTDDAPSHTQLPTELVIRDSCGCGSSRRRPRPRRRSTDIGGDDR
jgi:LacI family transcriptional regulator